MDNIKLVGMKNIRTQRNISLEKLAKDLNLMDATILDMVVTPDYLNKIETRKQKNISDKLLEALSSYFNVTIQSLIDNTIIEPKKEETRNIRVRQQIGNTGKYDQCICSVPLYFSDSFILNSCNILYEAYNKCNTTELWKQYVEQLKHLFEEVKKLDSEQLNMIMDDEGYQKWFLERYTDRMKHSYLLDIADVAQTLYFYFRSKGVPIDDIPTLVIGLIEMYINLNLL